MKITLIISTYNWPEALELILKSVMHQSKIPDEILIADDGSKKNTKDLINTYQKKLNLIHVWHEDKGFRKSVILNKAIARSKGEYIIQIDGDILIHKHFIKDHLKHSKENTFIHGSRVFLGKELTKNSIKDSCFVFSFFEKNITNRFNMIHSPFLANIFSRKSKSLKGTRGCNFSFFKNDFIKVNGYNEDLTGWGKEDSELSARLINNNIIKKKLKFSALTYHLFHEFSSKENLQNNSLILNKVITENIKECNDGVRKYI